MTERSGATLVDLARERGIVVCCGPGGVGGTATLAAMLVVGARS